jgi:hypothetical protein
MVAGCVCTSRQHGLFMVTAGRAWFVPEAARVVMRYPLGLIPFRSEASYVCGIR